MFVVWVHFKYSMGAKGFTYAVSAEKDNGHTEKQSHGVSWYWELENTQTPNISTSIKEKKDCFSPTFKDESFLMLTLSTQICEQVHTLQERTRQKHLVIVSILNPNTVITDWQP